MPSINTPVIHSVKTPDLLTPLRSDEIKLIRAYRCMSPRHRIVIGNTADRMASENRSVPALRIVGGGVA